MHPAHQQSFAAGIGRAQLSAAMSAAKVAEKIQFHFCH